MTKKIALLALATLFCFCLIVTPIGLLIYKSLTNDPLAPLAGSPLYITANGVTWSGHLLTYSKTEAAYVCAICAALGIVLFLVILIHAIVTSKRLAQTEQNYIWPKNIGTTSVPKDTYTGPKSSELNFPYAVKTPN